MSELLALGASHKTAPIELRERLALTEARAEQAVRELLAGGDVLEAVVVSTCNRTELYVVAPDSVAAESAVLALLARQAGIRPTELLDRIYSLRNCDAARHLFRVASGLDSMVLGETEVQGQVKRAYDQALAAGATGPLTNRLFRAALATGKRVRTETAISENRISVASVAVDLAREVIGDLASRHVLVIGAGETSEGTARALHAQGVSTMFVANRRRARALALAQRFGGRTASFDDLPAELERADIVVSSTSSPHTIVGADELAVVLAARRATGRGTLLLIDLAVPRDVEPECRELDDVILYDVDDLQAQVNRSRSIRRAEARSGEAIVEEEIQAFAAWLGSLEATPTVAALRRHGLAIAEQVLAENAGRWEDLSERDRERVEAIARTVVQRILHEPTVRMKRAEPERLHARIELVRELFGLDETSPDIDADRPAAEVHPLPRRRGSASA